MDMQKLLNALSDAGRRDRARYHVTLGKMIEAIKHMPGNTPVVFDGGDLGPGSPHSYRGYYSDLAFEGTKGVTIASFLKDCRDSLDSTYDGYKGGDFLMDANTPLWWASYGCSGGRAIVDIRDEQDRLVLVTKEID